MSNSQICREISNKKLNYHLFCFSFTLTRFLCRENALPKMIKHYRYAMSDVVNKQNTYDSVRLEAGESQKFGKQERCCNLSWLQYVCKLYWQNTSSQTRNHYMLGILACVCVIRHQQRSRWGFPKESSACVI